MELTYILQKKFHIKDFDILNYFLGIEIDRLSKGVFLSQMFGCKPTDSSIDPHTKLVKTTGDLSFDEDRYRS